MISRSEPRKEYSRRSFPIAMPSPPHSNGSQPSPSKVMPGVEHQFSRHPPPQRIRAPVIELLDSSDSSDDDVVEVFIHSPKPRTRAPQRPSHASLRPERLVHCDEKKELSATEAHVDLTSKTQAVAISNRPAMAKQPTALPSPKEQARIARQCKYFME